MARAQVSFCVVHSSRYIQREGQNGRVLQLWLSVIHLPQGLSGTCELWHPSSLSSVLLALQSHIVCLRLLVYIG